MTFSRRAILGSLLLLSFGLGSGIHAFQTPLSSSRVVHQSITFSHSPILQQHRRTIFSAPPLYVLSSDAEDGSTNSAVSASATSSDVESDKSKTLLGNPELDKLAIQGGLALVALFFLYTVLTTLLTAAGGVVSSAASQLPGALLGLIAAIFGAVWEGAQIVLPALAKALGAVFQAAAPVVQQASQAVGDAASPYVDEATRNIGEAAAPYLDQLNTAVDTQIVAPLSSAVDSTLNQVTSSVSEATDQAMKQVTTSVSEATDQAMNSVKSAMDTTGTNTGVTTTPLP